MQFKPSMQTMDMILFRWRGEADLTILLLGGLLRIIPM